MHAGEGFCTVLRFGHIFACHSTDREILQKSLVSVTDDLTSIHDARFKKTGEGYERKISPLLSREGCKTWSVCNLSDMRESVKNSNCPISRHARFMVAPLGFRGFFFFCSHSNFIVAFVLFTEWCQNLDPPEFKEYVIVVELVGDIFLVFVILTILRSKCSSSNGFFNMEMVGAELGLGGKIYCGAFKSKHDYMSRFLGNGRCNESVKYTRTKKRRRVTYNDSFK